MRLHNFALLAVVGENIAARDTIIFSGPVKTIYCHTCDYTHCKQSPIHH